MPIPLKVIVSLRGGLGNQLFQTAAALSVAESGKVGLEWSLGKPQLNDIGKPEITSLKMPDRVILEDSRDPNWLERKAEGYLLRSSIEPRAIEMTHFFKKASSILGRGVLSRYFRENRVPFSATDTGYVQIPASDSKSLLIGYFQSFRWASNPSVKNELSALSPRRFGNDYLQMVEHSMLERPLVVHVRLGDYKGVKEYGLPTSKYYSNSIRKMLKEGDFGKIWVFSDEPELASRIIPAEFANQIRWIPLISNSVSTTWSLMRFGKGYVIGNSTFSWWAAFLSHTQDAPVIAPAPWFQNKKPPRDLIPPNWVQISAQYDLHDPDSINLNWR